MVSPSAGISMTIVPTAREYQQEDRGDLRKEGEVERHGGAVFAMRGREIVRRITGGPYTPAAICAATLVM